MAPRRWAASLDMYRKVPVDLMEGTKRGSALSLVALFTIAVLFLLETKAYLQSHWTTSLTLDDNVERRIRVNFNITMMDMKCDFAVVDVVSVLGKDQFVAAAVTKWDVDAEGVRQQFSGRNRKAKNEIHLKDDKVTYTLEELHEDGEDAVSLDEQTFEYALKQHEYLFLDFYASWCSHCRDLAPTWETLAEVMADAAEQIAEDKLEHDYSEDEFEHAASLEKPVFIAKIDCVDHHKFCIEHDIRAYPTLRLFVDGVAKGDYRADRTVMAMTDWLHSVEEEHKKGTDAERRLHVAFEAAQDHMGEEELEWKERIARKQKHKANDNWLDVEHPGCQIAGHLMVERVPGNFAILARSPQHSLLAYRTNTSHIVHHLSIGDPMSTRMVTDRNIFTPDEIREKMTPMNGNAYVTRDMHQSFHHYLKVVTTQVPGMNGNSGRRGSKMAYQILQSSQLTFYENDIAPEAKFILDLSPIKVSLENTSRHWYDYVTSILAIIGGTFSVVGMLEGGIQAVASRKRAKRY